MATRGSAWPVVGALASIAGVAATAQQIVERVALAEDPHVKLFCNISEYVSCSDALLAPQASVFGTIPNSVIGLAMFAVLLTAFVVAAGRTNLSRGLIRGVQFLLLCMGAFVAWFAWQTAYVIGALCVYCSVNATAVVIANLAWWKSTHRRSGSESLLALGSWLLLAALTFHGLRT